MIFKQINFSEFCDSFSETYKNNFSYEGKRALFDWLEQYSEDTGENIELDTVALCCEYDEWKDIEQYNENYGTQYTDASDIDEQGICILIDINDTSFITSSH